MVVVVMTVKVPVCNFLWKSICTFATKIRLYQFPLENALVVTELDKKKWRRCVLKGTASTAAPAAQPVKKTIKKN